MTCSISVASKHFVITIVLAVFLATASYPTLAQGQHPVSAGVRPTDRQAAVEKTWKLLDEVLTMSYPELSGDDVVVKAFSSEEDFFKARFSFGRYLTFRRLKIIIFVNPEVFRLNAPEAGLKSILAHELAHALYFKTRNRLKLLGLARMTCGNFAAGFERGADLTTISRGYADGLIEYRSWLYKNIPNRSLSKKRRNYFSPEEITVLNSSLQKDPALLEKLEKKIPRNLTELIVTTRSIKTQ